MVPFESRKRAVTRDARHDVEVLVVATIFCSRVVAYKGYTLTPAGSGHQCQQDAKQECSHSFASFPMNGS